MITPLLSTSPFTSGVQPRRGSPHGPWGLVDDDRIDHGEEKGKATFSISIELGINVDFSLGTPNTSWRFPKFQPIAGAPGNSGEP